MLHLTKLIAFSTILSSSLLAFEYDLQPKKVASNVWCFFGKLEMPTKENGGDMSNSCWVKANNSYVVFDTGATFKYAKQSYEEMSKIEKLPVSTVFNSHFHDDHWLGNSFYKEKFDAELIGVKAQDDTYKPGDTTRMFKFLTKEAVEGTKIVPLDEHMDKTQTKVVDGLEVKIVHVGKSHSKEDIYFYLPKQKVVFAGDLVMNGRITSNRDGRVVGQLKALESIQSQDWDVLVAGHGFDVSKTAIDESVKYFTLLKERVLNAVDEDTGLSGVSEYVQMDEFKDKAMFDLLNGLNVSEAYSELEFYDGE
jgi:glyoxylase-like metal-dependent hydrolase (beta-lactamase superfamily II)